MEVITNLNKPTSTLATEPRKTLILAFLLVFGAIALALSTLYGGWVILILIALIIGLVVFLKPEIGFGLLVPALFLEADALSLDLPLGRVRFYHILIVILFAKTLFDLARAKITWKKTVLDWPIVIYLGINAVAIYFAPDKIIALKIMGVLVLMAMLYWSIIQYVVSLKQFKKLTNWLVGSAIVVGLVGLFQVATEWLSQTFGIHLWNGQVVHSDVIPFGRPFGTFVEPDWFGTFIMVAFVIAGTLFLAKVYRNSQLKWLIVSTFLGAMTLLSAVRGAWLGLVAASISLIYFNKKYLKALNLKILVPTIGTLGVLSILALLFIPDLATAISDRFLTLSTLSTVAGEPRFITMKSGWEIWLSAPWIGYGPGAFKTLGVIPFVTPLQGQVMNLEAFQTNAILTVLVDTGLAGLAAVVWGAYRFVRRTTGVLKRATKKTNQEAYTLVLALFAAVIGLAVAFQVTAGLWLGLSWFLVALTVAGTYVLEPLKKQ